MNVITYFSILRKVNSSAIDEMHDVHIKFYAGVKEELFKTINEAIRVAT